MNRTAGRLANQLRPITFETNFSKYAEGSVLTRFGETHVLCNVSIDDSLPSWIKSKEKPHGWLTAEYAMLPRSTHHRVRRENRWPKGRTQEISRLIGRCLRMALDLEHLGDRQLIVDCDVLQADGGTRTAAICGGWLAVYLALAPLIRSGAVRPAVHKHQIGAISVGLIKGVPILDLDYSEDVAADVDLNIVMTASNKLVEVQGTAENAPFIRDQLERLIDLAQSGIQQLTVLQNYALND